MDDERDSTPSGPGRTILYFGADPRASRLTTAGLRLAGYQVTATETAADALGALQAANTGFAAAVIDAVADSEGARAVIGAIDQRFGGQVPVILLVSRCDPHPIPEAATRPALKRPFATPSLVRLLRQKLRESDHGPEQVTPPGPDSTGSHPVLRLGKYDLIAEIGRGGMGTVFLCRRSGDHGFHRVFALKRMHPHLVGQEQFTSMLLDEARIASRLHHPNVAAVVDLDRVGGSYFIVMEYVEGPSLYELFRRVKENRSAELLVPLFINVLEGLHAAHVLDDDKGEPLQLVHRDVSPHNVLVGIDGFARLSDFGVAKARARLTATAVGVRKGKLSYIAPELLMDPASADARSDLFSVGVMMWSALTARRLFAADAEAATMHNVLEQPIPPPSTIGLMPPPCLDAIVLKALERDPTQRYRSAHEMAEDLRRVAGVNHLLASPTKIGRWVREAWADEATERRRAVRFAAESVRGVSGSPDTHVAAATELALDSLVMEGSPSSSSTMDTLSDEHVARVDEQPKPAAPRSPRTALFARSIAAVAVVAGVLLWQAALRGDASGDGSAATAADEGQAGPAEAIEKEPPVPPEPPPPCPDGMVFVEGGKFFMGSDAEAPVLRSANPAHQVEVGDFCIDATEVTLEAYRKCSDEGACKRAYRDSWWPQGSKDHDEWTKDREVHSQLCNEKYDDRGKHPVNCVTWHQAEAYCRHVGKILPSEAQWEFAARRSDGRVYSWGDNTPDSERMNGCGSECVQWREAVEADPTPTLYEADDGYPGTAPVGSFPAGNTKEGISDLAGNVFEWTADEFRPYGEVGKLAKESPGRVIRGGAFNSFMPEFADPALRFPLVADAHSHGVGFRCAAKPND